MHVFQISITFIGDKGRLSLAAIVSEKNPLFSLFPREKPKLPNLTCRKIGQGHSRVFN